MWSDVFALSPPDVMTSNDHLDIPELLLEDPGVEVELGRALAARPGPAPALPVLVVAEPPLGRHTVAQEASAEREVVPAVHVLALPGAQGRREEWW
jgi:hypothetical protein